MKAKMNLMYRICKILCSEILLEVCRGLSNQEIADKLFISKRTVDKHRANILEKTGCKNTANLVVYAIKNHLVEI